MGFTHWQRWWAVWRHKGDRSILLLHLVEGTQSMFAKFTMACTESSLPCGIEYGSPLYCSCLGNPMDRGAWWAIVQGVTRVEHGLVTKPPTTTRTFLPAYSRTLLLTGNSTNLVITNRAEPIQNQSTSLSSPSASCLRNCKHLLPPSSTYLV